MIGNNENAEGQLATQRDKLKKLLTREDSLSVQNIDQTLDLNQHKKWVFKLIKRTFKLQGDLDFDFITELNVMRRNQSQLDELLRRNTELERMNQELSEEVLQLRDQENDRAMQMILENNAKNDQFRRASQRNMNLNQAQSMEMEMSKLHHLIDQADQKCLDLSEQVREMKLELLESNKLRDKYEDELIELRPKVQDQVYAFQGVQEQLKEFKNQVKILKEENQQKEDELVALQTDYMSYRRQNTQSTDKKNKEIEGMQDKLKFYKKSVEKLTQDKDRLKGKIKTADLAKAEQDKIIENYKILQETLNQDRRRIDERINKMNEEENLRNSLRGLRPQSSVDVSMVSGLNDDDKITAVIDDDRLHVIITDQNGKEIKVKLRQTQAVEKSYSSDSQKDNSMMALETDNPNVERHQSRFSIFAPDFNQEFSQQSQVHGPRNFNRGLFDFEEVQEDQLDENGDQFVQTQTNFIQEEPHPNFGDRSFISNHNNSYFEGGDLILPPALGKGANQGFFGFDDGDDEDRQSEQQIEDFVGEQNNNIPNEQLTPDKLVQENNHYQHKNFEQHEEDNVEFTLPVSFKKGGAKPNRFSFGNSLGLKFGLNEQEDDEQQQEIREQVVDDIEQDGNASEGKNSSFHPMSNQSMEKLKDGAEDYNKEEQQVFILEERHSKPLTASIEIQTDPVEIRPIRYYTNQENQTTQVQINQQETQTYIESSNEECQTIVLSFTQVDTQTQQDYADSEIQATTEMSSQSNQTQVETFEQDIQVQPEKVDMSWQTDTVQTETSSVQTLDEQEEPPIAQPELQSTSIKIQTDKPVRASSWKIENIQFELIEPLVIMRSSIDTQTHIKQEQKETQISTDISSASAQTDDFSETIGTQQIQKDQNQAEVRTVSKEQSVDQEIQVSISDDKPVLVSVEIETDPVTAIKSQLAEVYIQTVEKIYKSIGLQTDQKLLLNAEMNTISKEIKNSQTSPKQIPTKSQNLQTDQVFFTEQEELYYKSTRTSFEGGIYQEARMSTTSTKQSFKRMPHGNEDQEEMYDSFTDLNQSMQKQPPQGIQKPKTRKPEEPRHEDESCVKGCKVQ